MKRFITILILFIGSVVGISLCFRKDVPIIECIGLRSTLDQKTKHFNRGVIRNVLYENKSDDPLFYSKIINSIKMCEWAKAKGLVEKDSVDGEIFILKGSPFQENSLFEKHAFVSKDWHFMCVVYNGGDFVLVVLTARYN
jgi:hypothetical protein